MFDGIDPAQVLSNQRSLLQSAGKGVTIGGNRYCAGFQQLLLQETDLDARTIVEKSLQIAADICIYTNHQLTIEELEIPSA